MKSNIAPRGTLTQHERLQQEWKEHRRYANYGDKGYSTYTDICNQCPDLGTDSCSCCKIYKDYYNIKL